jgi:hypothetical protein
MLLELIKYLILSVIGLALKLSILKHKSLTPDQAILSAILVMIFLDYFFF